MDMVKVKELMMGLIGEVLQHFVNFNYYLCGKCSI